MHKQHFGISKYGSFGANKVYQAIPITLDLSIEWVDLQHQIASPIGRAPSMYFQDGLHVAGQVCSTVEGNGHNRCNHSINICRPSDTWHVLVARWELSGGFNDICCFACS